MARAFDNDTLDLLDGDGLVERDLLIITLPEGTFGFWSDVIDVEFSAFPGVVFTGSGSLITLAPVAQTVGDTVQSVEAVLSGLSTDVLASIGVYNLHAGTVEIARALYDPSTRALVAVVTVFRGLIDRDELREDAEETRFVAQFVSRAREMDRASNRRGDFADQQRDFAGDRGFEFIAKAGTEPIKWGDGQKAGSLGPGR